MIADKNNKEKYISLREAARLYGCTQKHMALMARKKKLKAIKLDRNWVTTISWLEEYAQSIERVDKEKPKQIIPKLVFKKALTTSLICILLFAFIGTTFVLAKEQALFKPVEQFIGKIIKLSFQSSNLASVRVFYYEKYGKYLASSKFSEIIKTIARGQQRTKQNVFAFFDKLFTQPGKLVINIVTGTSSFTKYFFTYYLPHNFKSFFILEYLLPSYPPTLSDQPYITIKDLYKKLADIRERIEGEKIIIQETIYQTVKEVIVTKPIEIQKEVIKDEAVLADWKSDILSEVDTRLSGLETSIYETTHVENIYYFTEAVGAARINTFNEDITFNEGVNMNKNLTVVGSITAGGALSIAGNLSVTGTSTFTGAAIFAGDVNISGDIDIDSGVLFVDADNNYVGINTTTPSVELSVIGTAFISQDLRASGSVQFGGGEISTVSYSRFGLADTTHSLLDADDLLISGLFEVDDYAYFDSSLFVDGTASISDDFYVGGDLFFVDVSENNVYASAGFDVASLTDGTLTIDGSGNIIGGNYFSFSNASISDDLTVSDVFTVRDGLVSISDDFYVGDDLLVTHIADDGVSISGDFEVTGDVTLGSATTNILVVNSYVGSDLIPESNNYSIGTTDNRWVYGYFDEITVATISATGTAIGGTTAAAFSINTDNATNDTEDAYLTFERGIPVTNASLKWDSTNTRFDVNFPFYIDNNLLVDGTASISDTLYVENTFTVASGSNIDSGTLYVDAADNNVGIGTIAPNYKLAVDGTASVSGGLWIDTMASISGDFSVASSGYTSGDDYGPTLYVDTPNDRIGIGTNNPDANSKLDVSGVIRVTGGIAVGTHAVSNGAILMGDSGGERIYFGQKADNASNYYNAHFRAIYNNATLLIAPTYLGFYTNATTLAENQEVMRLTASGNVGIGTTVPSTELSIVGTASISQDLWASGSFQFGGGVTTATVSYSRLGAGNTGHSLADADDLLISGMLEVDGYAYFNGPIYLQDDINWLTVNGGSIQDVSAWTQITFRVGSAFGRQLIIGDTAISANYDHTTQTNPTLYIQSATNPDIDNTEWLSFAHDGANASISVGQGGLLFSAASASEAVYIDIDGNVGIGTGEPNARLEVKEGGLNVALRLDAASGHNHLEFADQDSNSEWLLYLTNGAADLTLREAGIGDKVTFQAGGNVGIGTIAPNYKLAVDGTASISDTLYVENTFTVASGSNIDSGTLYVDAATDRVGIGTTEPNYLFEVAGATATASFLGDVKIGDGTPDYLGAATENLYVEGELEVDNDAYFGDWVHVPLFDPGHTRYGIVWGGTTYQSMLTADIDRDQMRWLLSSQVGNQLVIGYGDWNESIDDFDHVPQTNPTIFIHSATDPDTDNTEWLSFAHDGANASISVGQGGFLFSPASASEAVYIDIDGNVGIGTNAPRGPLDIYNGELYLGTDGVANALIKSENEMFFYIDNDNDDGTAREFTFTTGGPGKTELMRIVGTGNVGIGDTNPSYTLSVDGTASISDDFYVGNDMLFADLSLDEIFSSASWDISGDLDFTRASLSDSLTLTDNLHITSGIIDVDGTASSTFAGDLDIEGDVNIGNGDLQVDVSSGNVLINNGNVGIGTTAPNGKLAIDGGNILLGNTAAGTSADNVLALADGTAPTTNIAGAQVWAQSGGLYIAGQNSATAVNFQIQDSAFSPEVTVLGNGNVGIGDTDPQFKLSVDGTASVSGQCVTGDSLLPIVKDNFQFSISNFQSIFNDLIFKQIKDVKPGDYVLSLNEKTGKLVPARINGLMDMGVQPIYELETEDGKTIRTTGNHPYLVKTKLIPNSTMLDMGNFDNRIFQTELNPIISTPQSEILGLSASKFFNFPMLQGMIEFFQFSDFVKNLEPHLFGNSQEFLSGSGLNGNLEHNDYFASLANLRTSLRDIQDLSRSASAIRSSVSLIDSGEESSTKSIISSNNSLEMTLAEANTPRRFFSLIMTNGDFLDIYSNDNKMDNELSSAEWIKVHELNIGDEIAVVDWKLDVQKMEISNGEWKLENSNQSPISEQPISFVKIKRITQLPPEQVYDIEVEDTHNFVANGIIAHNTYLYDTLTVASGSNIDSGTLYVDAATDRVGIGTTSPVQLLHLESADPRIWLQDTTNNNSLLLQAANTVGFIGVDDNQAVGSSELRFQVDASDKMTILSDGNVGIGTSHPSESLHLVDSNEATTFYIDTYDDGTEYSDLVFRRSNTDTIGDYTETDDGDILGNIGFRGVDNTGNFDLGGSIQVTQDGVAGSRVPAKMVLRTFSDSAENANQLVLASTSYVGIGTTGPETKLHVENGTIFAGDSGSSAAGIAIYGQRQNSLVSATTPSFYTTGSAGGSYPYNETGHLIIAARANDDRDMIFKTGASGDTRMTILGNGNVGIGTTGPDYTLSVDGTASVSGAFYVMDNLFEVSNTSVSFGGTTSVSFAGDLDIEGDVNIGNGDLQVDVSSGNVLINNGNVGIGTTGPLSKLHVHEAGTASVSGQEILTLSETIVAGTVGSGPRISFRDQGDLTYEVANIRAYTWGSSPYTGLAFGTGYTQNDISPVKMVIDPNGNVGIGTTEPGSKLHVNTTANYPIYAESTTGTAATSWKDSASTGWSYVAAGAKGDDFFITAGGSEKVRVDSSGNVGIGTTGPTKALEVYGTGNANPILSDGLAIADDRSYAAGVGGTLLFLGEYHSSDTPTIFAGIRGVKANAVDTDYDGQLEFFTRKHGDNDWTGDQRMVIDEDGNVGIGTTGPGEKVEIKVTNGDNVAGLFIDQDDTGEIGLLIDSESTSQPGIQSQGKYVGYFSQDVSGGYGLSVNRNIAEAGSEPLVKFRDDNVANTQTTLRVQQDGSGDIINLFDGATEVFTVLNGGNVGIGTTSPRAKLQVTVPTNGSVDIVNEAPIGSYAGIRFATYDVADGFRKSAIFSENVDSYERQKLHFALENTLTGTNVALSDAKMTIQADGNVGIGTTGPDYTLSVDGTASVSGAFYVMDNLFEVSNTSVFFGGTTSVSFAGDLDIEGDVNIGNGDLYVDASSGNVYLGSDLTIAGNKITFGNGSVIDNETNGTLWLRGDGAIHLDDATTLDGTLAVTGATTLTGLLTANGGITADSGVFTVADTTGAIHTGNNLDVDGVITAGSTPVTLTGATGYILETAITQNSLDDSEIEDNSLTAGSLAADSVGDSELFNGGDWYITSSLNIGTNGDALSISTDGYLSDEDDNVHINDGLNIDNSVFIADTANSQMSLGLTVNQGGYDNEILSLKSSDVAHGVTSWTETDTYFSIRKKSAATGGTDIRTGSEDGSSFYLWAFYDGSGNIAKDGTAYAPVMIEPLKRSGTTYGQCNSNENIFAIRTVPNGSGEKTVFIVDEDGDLLIDGALSQNAWDLAEYFDSENPNANLSIGTIISSKGAKKVGTSTREYDKNIIGIVSNPEFANKMGHQFDDNNSEKTLVGLSGTLEVRVNNEGGLIETGDYITASSVAGVGMKANKPGMVVGRAYEDWDGISDTVRVILGNRYVGAEELNIVNVADAPAASLIIDSLGNVSIGNSASVSGDLYVGNQLCLGETCINEEQLKTQLGDPKVTIEYSGGLGDFISNLVSGLEQLGVSIKDGVISAAKLVVDEVKTKILRAKEITIEVEEGQDNVVGSAIIPAQSIEYRVENSLVQENSKIFITFTSDTGGRTWHISEKVAGNGFTIRLSNVTPEPLDFDYWILLVEDQDRGSTQIESASQNTQINADPYCGDGELQPGEECDDGNTINGDGCDSTCMLEDSTLITNEDEFTNDTHTEETTVEETITSSSEPLIEESVEEPVEEEEPIEEESIEEESIEEEPASSSEVLQPSDKGEGQETI